MGTNLDGSLVGWLGPLRKIRFPIEGNRIFGAHGVVRGPYLSALIKLLLDGDAQGIALSTLRFGSGRSILSTLWV